MANDGSSRTEHEVEQAGQSRPDDRHGPAGKRRPDEVVLRDLDKIREKQPFSIEPGHIAVIAVIAAIVVSCAIAAGWMIGRRTAFENSGAKDPSGNVNARVDMTTLPADDLPDRRDGRTGERPGEKAAERGHGRKVSASILPVNTPSPDDNSDADPAQNPSQQQPEPVRQDGDAAPGGKKSDNATVSQTEPVVVATILKKTASDPTDGAADPVPDAPLKKGPPPGTSGPEPRRSEGVPSASRRPPADPKSVETALAESNRRRPFDASMWPGVQVTWNGCSCVFADGLCIQPALPQPSLLPRPAPVPKPDNPADPAQNVGRSSEPDSKKTASMTPVVTEKPAVAKKTADTKTTTGQVRPPEPKKPVESKKYSVQIRSFKEKELADQFAEQIRAKGYNPVIVTFVDQSGTTWYRIRTGKFESAADAASFARDLNAKESEQAIPVEAK